MPRRRPHREVVLPNASGAYQVRHDFVHSINKGDHDVNHIVIVGDTLYIGNRGGRPQGRIPAVKE